VAAVGVDEGMKSRRGKSRWRPIMSFPSQPFKLVSRQSSPSFGRERGRSADRRRPGRRHRRSLRRLNPPNSFYRRPCRKKTPAPVCCAAARTNRHLPYRFPGLGVGSPHRSCTEASKQTGLPLVTEVMSTEDIRLICEYADMLQVGARNRQNFALWQTGDRCASPCCSSEGIGDL